MSESENIVAKIKNNKKAIAENAHVISIILLVAFIIIDIIIILYLLYENDKYHVIYPDVSRSQSIEVKDYLTAQGIEASLNEKGQVVVPKADIELATSSVDTKFDFYKVEVENVKPIQEDESTTEELGEVLLATNELENLVANSLEKHVAINKAVVRIEDYGSQLYDVSAVAVLTLVSGIDLHNADLDTINWLISSLIDGCEVENITLINADTNTSFEGGTQTILE